MKEIIRKYQCAGCVNSMGCFKKADYGDGCGAHVPGTTLFGIGRIYLGLPKGFCRVGDMKEIWVCEEFESFDKFNVPVWKHFDGTVTMVRGLSPRINAPFLYLFKGNHLDKIDCLEINDFEGID